MTNKTVFTYLVLCATLVILYSPSKTYSINYPCDDWWCSGLWGSLWTGEGLSVDLGYGFSLGSVSIGGNLGDEGYEGGWGIRYGIEF